MNLALWLPLLQEPTPDTTNYLILGYVIMGAVGLAYVISLVVRQRNLKHDLQVIEQLQSTED